MSATSKREQREQPEEDVESLLDAILAEGLAPQPAPRKYAAVVNPPGARAYIRSQLRPDSRIEVGPKLRKIISAVNTVQTVYPIFNAADYESGKGFVTFAELMAILAGYATLADLATKATLGGDTTGAAIVLGAKDNFALNLISDSVNSVSVSSAGLLLNGSTSGALTMEAAAITTPYAVTWPATQGGASSVLTNNGSGTLTWAGGSGTFFEQGGNAFAATAVLGTTDNNNVTIIANNNVTALITPAGELSVSDSLVVGGRIAGHGGTIAIANAALNGFVEQTVQATAFTNYVIQWPNAQGASNTVLTNNGAGILSWASSAADGAFVQGGDAFGVQAILGTTDNNSLAIITDNTQALLIAANQAVTVSSTLAVNGASAAIGLSGTTTGSLLLESAGGGAVTLAAPASGVTPYAAIWPPTQGGATSLLTNNGSGTLSWVSGPGTYFRQSGNAFGAGAVLGTTDNNSLKFITDNTQAALLSAVSAGAVTMTVGLAGSTTGTLALAGSTSGAATFTANTVGTFVTASSALAVQGASVTVGLSGITTGSLALASAGLNTVTIAAPASGVTSYQTTWPATQGAATTMLTNNGSGVLSWATPAANGAFVNGGNAFGGTAVFGTTDAHGIQIETAGTIAATFNTSQGVTFNGNVQALNGQLFTGQAAGPVVGSLIMYSSAGTELTLAPGSAAGYTFSFPAAVPSAASGYFLTANTSSTTSWSNAPFIQGGNSYGADGLLGTNDAHGLNIYANNAGGTNPGLFIDTSQNVYSGFFSNFTVKSGVLAIGSQSLSTAAITLFNASNSNNVSITTPAVSSTYQITLPASLPAHAGYHLTTNNTTGATSWIAPAIANNPTQVSSGGTTSTTYVTTGIVCTITPQFTNSAILVTASFSISNSAGVNNAYATLTQQIASGTIVDLSTGTAVGTVSKPFVSANVGGAFSVPATITFLAQPNTTSTVTYTVYMATGSGADTVTVNANNVATIVAVELSGGNVSTFMARSPIRVVEPEDDFLDSVLI